MRGDGRLLWMGHTGFIDPDTRYYLVDEQSVVCSASDPLVTSGLLAVLQYGCR